MKILLGFVFRQGVIKSCWLLLAVIMIASPLEVRSQETDDFIQQWQIDNQWTGDFDGMVERRLIRVLVVSNKMMFFFDKAQIRGVTHDAFKEFEKFINRKLKIKSRKIKIVFIPVTRNKLLPWLQEGRGDIAAANLTITYIRQKSVDFANPIFTNVSEILITGPSAPQIESIESLSGKEVHVRPSSSYFEHLIQLNSKFAKQGKPPVKIVATADYLEDSDLIEMVNAGLIPMIFVDDHKAKFWAQIFSNITLHTNISLNTEGKIAWSIRKDSPKLKAITNEFVKTHKKGTLLGNVLFKITQSRTPSPKYFCTARTWSAAEKLSVWPGCVRILHT